MTTTGRRVLGRQRALSALIAVIAVTAAACGGPEPTPSPGASAAATRSPRHGELDQAQAVWEERGPRTVAYTTTETGDAGTTSVHAVTIDGRTETLVIQSGPLAPDPALFTVDGLFDRAHAALDASGTLDYTVDQLTGRLSEMTFQPASGGGGWTVTVGDLVTPADRGSAGLARQALEQVLQAWKTVDSPTWAYTWTRFGAADTAATATAYRVEHDDGTTSVAAADGSSGTAAPPDAATIEGTVAGAAATLAAGGWVNVAADATGLNLLIGIDPSPSAAGDGYWIRIAYTDLFASRAAEKLAAAKDRWTSAGLARYAYAWRFEGADAAWGWNVTIKRGSAKLKPTRGAPAVEAAFAGPGVTDLFSLIDRILAGGGSVVASYDKELGYPGSVEIRDGAGIAPAGVITISRFKTR